MTSYIMPGQSGTPPALAGLGDDTEFPQRHIGPSPADVDAMLQVLDLPSLDALIGETVPAAILHGQRLALPAPCSEQSALTRLRTLLADDRPGRAYIGMGYYDTFTPAVIQRNVLENPGWYTAYTPYQPEIAQGRLECLLNFQQMVMDLTGMELANASLLDEATAAAEAMALARRSCPRETANTFFVDQDCFPQTIDVVCTRARCFGFDVVVGDPATLGDHDVFGALFQYPGTSGVVRDLAPLITQLHERQAIAVVAADLLGLVLLKSPAELGADVVVGSTQRFGVPMGYGGPHAAYFATRMAYRRSVPGRMIGVSVDARRRPALRMALQTREQHIRREKANSNICTAQVLLANVAALYAMYHGPAGLTRIANRVHRLTQILALGLSQAGLAPVHGCFFDTLTLRIPPGAAPAVLRRADAADVSLRLDSEDGTQVGISLDECSTAGDVERLWRIFLGDAAAGLTVDAFDQTIQSGATAEVLAADLLRSTAILQHPNFNLYHSETEMLRYLKRLEDRDISLTRSMIPLGSCTMKLNATAEMLPISWPEIARVHPFIDRRRVPGYQCMIRELEEMLMAITGFDAVSMQPNSGAQGEYAGLLAIRHYLDSIGQTQRDVCLIPGSAHGTNAASAQMVGMRIVIVGCDDKGNIDLEDLQAKAAAHGDKLAALMLTYPSTHGVFEEQVTEICALMHAHGAQVYMDGANLNAQVGLSRPADIGADVSHVNLHKTFCIPHGGGGPGMGPIGVKAHLAPFLSGHAVVPLSGRSGGAVSAAPWGSAGILPITWMYITMMGAEGLLQATRIAILNANYIATRLATCYDVLYTGSKGRVAHECIIDLRPLKQASGITEEDVAKRLMDFGFHAPTMSFPVAGTLMIEPTESESLAELDRFIDAMFTIRAEIAAVMDGSLDATNNPLKHAPHTLHDVVTDSWDRPYSREQAAFPAPWLRDNKYWPTVNRVDNAYGDRHLICSCPPLTAYQ